MSVAEHDILLRGLDGSNPLAFLAALGTQRFLTTEFSDGEVKMCWTRAEGAWRPRLICPLPANELVQALFRRLPRDRKNHPCSFVGDEEAIAAFFRQARLGCVIPAGDSDQWIASLVSDVHLRATSQLQLTRRDYFPGNLGQILANTTEENLRKTLFDPWRYDDRMDGQSLHIEPSEDRRHAYQWYKPNGDPNRKKAGTMLGANRLAIEAMPLFLGLPSQNPDRMRVSGWSGVRSDDSRWSWPIWEHPIDRRVVQSLLAFGELQEEKINKDRLAAMGVVAVYRSRRILVEQTPNLTPAISLM